jgi:hypothetical protein
MDVHQFAKGVPVAGPRLGAQDLFYIHLVSEYTLRAGSSLAYTTVFHNRMFLARYHMQIAYVTIVNEE